MCLYGNQKQILWKNTVYCKNIYISPLPFFHKWNSAKTIHTLKITPTGSMNVCQIKEQNVEEWGMYTYMILLSGNLWGSLL
jgi:hypothetical protein